MWRQRNGPAFRPVRCRHDRLRCIGSFEVAYSDASGREVCGEEAALSWCEPGRAAFFDPRVRRFSIGGAHARRERETCDDQRDYDACHLCASAGVQMPLR